MPPFRYTKLPDDHIRLVELVHDGTLRLSTHHMSQTPPFHALSYVWGQAAPQQLRKVSCLSGANVGEISVTPNLFEAFAYLRSHSDLPIWIDAICIDQESTTEKEILVPKMGQIYGTASRVLVWLGPEADESGLAMDVLNQLSGEEIAPLTSHQVASLSAALTRSTSIDITAEEFHRLGLPSLAHPMWNALRNLYFREWMVRVWTYQEVKLASEAVVLCGAKSVRWTTFLDLGLGLGRRQLLYLQLSDMSVQLDAFDYLVGDDSFLKILRTIRTRNCAQKEDRVFALLGLVSDAIRREIPAKYGDYHTVYRNTGALLLRKCGLDPVLAAASSSKPASLPSWCPDWSTLTTSRGVFSWAKAGNPMRAKANYDLSLTQLSVHGARIDKLALVLDNYAWHWPQGVTGENGPAHKLLQWLDECMSITRRCGLADRVCWETLVGDVPGGNPTNWITFPPSLEVGFRAFRKRLDENRRSVPIASTTMTQEERATLVPLLAYLGTMWRGRVFFSTEKGRVGFADKGVKEGDLACVFFGQPQIYILRQLWKVDDKINPATTFVSRSYVHGVMRGEACASLIDEESIVFEIS